MGLLTNLPLICGHGHMFCECLPTRAHIALTWGISEYYLTLSCTTPACNVLFLNLGVKLFTRSTGECVDATMKGPSEKGELFALLEYMKCGQLVTYSCAPLQNIEFFIRPPSCSPKPGTLPATFPRC